MVVGWTLVVMGLVVFVLGEPVGGGLLVMSGAVLHAGAMIAESVRARPTVQAGAISRSLECRKEV